MDFYNWPRNNPLVVVQRLKFRILVAMVAMEWKILNCHLVKSYQPDLKIFRYKWDLGNPLPRVGGLVVRIFSMYQSSGH